MKVSKRLRVGVLGTGVIVKDYHLPVLLKNDRAEVIALGNKHPDSLYRLADEFNIKTTYTDFETMAHDQDIDAVVIGLPNYLHAPVTIRMLEAGKHVLCEKPMAMSAAEAETMQHTAASTGRILMIAHMWRFDQEIRWLRAVIDSGVLGTIFKVKAQAVALGTLLPARNSWFWEKTYAGGGSFADIGIHVIDLISFLFHDSIRPRTVFAQAGNYFQAASVEDTANAIIRYDNGMSAIVETGWYHNFADGLEGAMQVFGMEGYARTFPTEMHYTVSGAWGQYRPVFPPRAQHCALPMYEAQMEHFLDSVLGKKRPEPDGQQGVQSMVLVDAIYESIRTGSSVSM